IAARLASDVAWNGVDQLTAIQVVLWGAALLVSPWLTTWGHARRNDAAALEDRINELLQIERSFAHTDPLTALYNRRAFVEALENPKHDVSTAEPPAKI